MSKLNLNELSYEELLNIQEDIEKEMSNRKDMRVYKISFYVGFISNKHRHDELLTADDFGYYFVNEPSRMIINDLNLIHPEDVSGFDVIELKPDQFPDMFKTT
jgi:hypothetical protein